MNNKNIVVALDFDNKKETTDLVDRLDPSLCRLKIGKEMFTHFGPTFVTEIQNKGFDVFLDLKFHDIPNTVAKAVKAAADLGVWMVNVHASGGGKMMDAAKTILQPFGNDAPLLIAVTVLTSMSDDDLIELGITRTPREQVNFLAGLAHKYELDGVVCSAQEAQMLKQNYGANFKLVTPGIRTADASVDDQKRIMTPQKAVAAGSDYLVIGRAITQSSNPIETMKAIYQSIN
ncbi:orotidine-5'-phosphate decarboxylase [Psychrosphaera sp. B3R10]|uniref:orotidine-5'-phosphate decarboxylase n=1 Tax=unclassified Psychrosphaera TaxID=2641570 RepID=UPI001C08909B|nr:orotidine-5'-phosphate decarboxylase [Psychrosphaera sp. 1_MG-2023]MBU2882341.1 orotidine-5'-phosphate decarboxylase [Psychrosphaera sp. I2R16]MBU2989022.1 orotidine-5'-phosphate decarboxylase [Psychrosphaera sp. B3R10]MDO6718019.1 orotidine-5'-phosphate decarboxylase [Psychrosphaera sp. 1_MG-2023]